MGTCLAFDLAGGEKGMSHMLDQFGLALVLPWTRLKSPKLKDEPKDRMVSRTRDQAGTLSVEEIERLRD